MKMVLKQKKKTFMFNLQMIFNFLINSNISSEKSFKLLCFRFQFFPRGKKQFPLQQRIVIELKWAQETFFLPQYNFNLKKKKFYVEHLAEECI